MAVINQKNSNLNTKGVSAANSESTLAESPTEGSEKEASLSESSVGADSEASESESASSPARWCGSSRRPCVHQEVRCPGPSASELPPPKELDSDDEQIAKAVSELRLSSPDIGDGDFDRAKELLSVPLSVPDNLGCQEEKHLRSHSLHDAFQTLSQSYVTTSKECSVQSCLYQFTSMELLMGNNKLLCENCTERKQLYPKEISCVGKYLA